MAERGYLEGSKMATAFNLLRSNDLVWPYVVNNYIKGEAPFPFDLLYWNSDATRMPAANHSYYLRNCYLDNNITKGKLAIDGVTIDLGRITIPIYNLATREDHIAPAKSVYLGSSAFGGPVRFVLSGSGHIAGVVNPPAKAEIPVLDRRDAEGRGSRRVAAPRHRASGLVVDRLDRLDQGTSARRSRGATPGGGKFAADRRRAGQLRESAQLSKATGGEPHGLLTFEACPARCAKCSAPSRRAARHQSSDAVERNYFAARRSSASCFS